MSLAYKLWKIGNVLTEEDVWDAMLDQGTHGGNDDVLYVNIDLTVTGETVTGISLNRQSIESSRLFLTKKIGGTSNSYYLYPNLNLQKSFVKDKVGLLVNTLEYGMIHLANGQNRKLVELALFEIEHIKDHIKRADLNHKISELLKRRDLEGNEKLSEKDLKKVIKDIGTAEKKLSELLKKQKLWNPALLSVSAGLVKIPKSDVVIWLSMNGKTFYELMPEIKDNWYKNPVLSEKLKMGFDAFTNRETKVGYRPEVKVFSQYRKSHSSGSPTGISSHRFRSFSSCLFA